MGSGAFPDDGLVIEHDGPYAGVDLTFSLKMSGVFWAFGLAIFGVLLPFYPPNHALGSWGWLPVAVSAPASVLMVVHLQRHPERMSMGRLLAQSYVSAAQLALVEWLAGGGHAPYAQLLGFSLFGVALGQPLRRAIPFAVYVGVLALLPLSYAREGFPVGVVATSLAVSLSICAFVALTMSHMRRQRALLANEGAAARSDALTDGLTGLGNRRAFNQALANAARTKVGLVVLLDLDDFKSINDNFGHHVGDECLVACAAALRESVRLPDACYRWGGDEFAVLLHEASDYATADAVLGRVRERLCERFQLPDGTAPRLTFGAARVEDGATPTELLVAADTRLLERKRDRKAHRLRSR